MKAKHSVPEQPLWARASLPRFTALKQGLKVDVAIVGGGVSGITTAYLLAREGVRVALIERERLAGADTARTTAHLTYVTDWRLHRLATRFGKEAARALWEAGSAAIDEIDAIARATRADCKFCWTPGYLHESLELGARQRQFLKKDADLARELGFDATLVERVPGIGRPGVRFAQQAKFHPREYLRALLPVIQEHRGHIFENTEFEQVDDKPMVVHANGQKIRCQYLVIATHNPLMGKKGQFAAGYFQSKLALYTSYVLGARLRPESLPEALYWDTADPYEYLRIDARRGYQYAIFGGEDVKTGQEQDANRVFDRLRKRLLRLLPQACVERRWMGQVIETNDGMPYIGENAKGQFIATGFSGNGITFGTLSAMMARDHYLGRKNPWSELFRVNRSPFHHGLWRYLKENADYPYYMLHDRLAGPKRGSVKAVRPGTGKIVRIKGETVAAYRSKNGALTLLSPLCTHLQCIVHWNNADQSWDCPCHGSRFHPTGEVMSGPAEEALAKKS